MYTSIQRHFRGFFFQRDYETKEQFNEDMISEAVGRSEICWAHLFADSGDRVAEYKRGYTTAEFL